MKADEGEGTSILASNVVCLCLQYYYFLFVTHAGLAAWNFPPEYIFRGIVEGIKGQEEGLHVNECLQVN